MFEENTCLQNCPTEYVDLPYCLFTPLNASVCFKIRCVLIGTTWRFLALPWHFVRYLRGCKEGVEGMKRKLRRRLKCGNTSCLWLTHTSGGPEPRFRGVRICNGVILVHETCLHARFQAELRCRTQVWHLGHQTMARAKAWAGKGLYGIPLRATYLVGLNHDTILSIWFHDTFSIISLFFSHRWFIFLSSSLS